MRKMSEGRDQQKSDGKQAKIVAKMPSFRPGKLDNRHWGLLKYGAVIASL
jgi:hypothetical protein